MRAPASAVRLTATGSPTVSGLHYRLGTSGLWLPYTIDTGVSLAAGESVQFRNTADTLSLSASSYAQFVTTGKTNASGNIQSMLNWRSDVPAYAFYSLFRNCPIYSPPELPATGLAPYCYSYLFWQTKFQTPPELPAVEPAEGCYFGTFGGSSITSCVINLTSLDLYSVRWMFRSVWSLRSIEVAFANWGEDPAPGWVYGVYTSGTFKKPTALPEEYGDNRIPTGWTVVDKQ